MEYAQESHAGAGYACPKRIEIMAQLRRKEEENEAEKISAVIAAYKTNGCGCNVAVFCGKDTSSATYPQ